jgi:hypothetical protein
MGKHKRKLYQSSIQFHPTDQFVYRTRDANSAMNMLQLTHKWIHKQIRSIEFIRNLLPPSIPTNQTVSTGVIPVIDSNDGIKNHSTLLFN